MVRGRKPVQHDSRMVSVGDAADYLGVCEKTVRNYIARGMIRPYRQGPRLIRVDLADLDALRRPIPSVADSR